MAIPWIIPNLKSILDSLQFSFIILALLVLLHGSYLMISHILDANKIATNTLELIYYYLNNYNKVEFCTQFNIYKDFSNEFRS